jgi:transketolase
MTQGQLPDRWDQDLPVFEAGQTMATRISSGKVLNAIGRRIPWLIGGSADLAPSTKTLLEFPDAGHFHPDCRQGRNLHFGIREHAMAGIANGMALCRLRPYVATFFVFSDYLRPSLRLSAVMHLPVLFIFTHDSIGLGEDGPTHQPIEHLAACRAIPNVIVIRPADANEVAQAYRVAMQHQHGPVALVLTRQDVPTLSRTQYASAEGLTRGAYVLADSRPGTPELILMASGSEVHVAASAYEQLARDGTAVRLVSMPSWELFEKQQQDYRESVLPHSVTRRIAVEAGVEQGWDRYLGPQGRFVGLHTFGASAPYEELYEHFGITAENVLRIAREALANR